MSKRKKPATDGRARRLRQRQIQQAMEQAIETAEREAQRKQCRPKPNLSGDPVKLPRLPKG